MNVDFKGYAENVATFYADTNVRAGDFVKISDNFKVTRVSSGDQFNGYCVNVRDGYAAVQLSGYVEAPCSAEITLGLTGIDAPDGVTVHEASGSEKHLVIYSTSSTVGFIL